MTEVQNIEDLLQVVLGKYGHNFVLKSSDVNLLNSFDRQIVKGVALTDRQFNLLKLKLEIYTAQFKKQEIKNWQYAIQNTEGEFRQIDRTKSITIVKKEDIVAHHRSYMNLKDGEYIKVRFPFNKKYIAKLDAAISINNTKTYFHEKNSHEHYFKLNALNCYKLHQIYPDWQTDNDIIEIANNVEKIIQDKDSYIPTYKNNNFYNIDEHIFVNNGDVKKISDKSIRYGFFIDEESNDTLLDTVAFRKEPTVLADSQQYGFQDIVNVLDYLDRYPLLVCVDKEHAFEQVEQIHIALSKFIPNNLQSVMFRVESSDKINSALNDFVKEKQLNNWVDKSTKVVYIKKDKLPKVLLKSDFKPITALCKSSLRSNRLVTNYVNFNCDLILYNDVSLSNFRTRYDKGWGNWQPVN